MQGREGRQKAGVRPDKKIEKKLTNYKKDTLRYAQRKADNKGLGVAKMQEGGHARQKNNSPDERCHHCSSAPVLP